MCSPEVLVNRCCCGHSTVHTQVWSVRLVSVCVHWSGTHNGSGNSVCWMSEAQWADHSRSLDPNHDLLLHFSTEVRVFAKPDVSTDRALLTCHVTTTDKSVSSVQLIGNGASQARWGSVTGPLPSEDGSVIFRLRAGISLNQNTNIYGCAVQTGGHNFTVFWGETFGKLAWLCLVN